MHQTPGPGTRLRFGEFELDLTTYELRRKGRRVKLGRQPTDLLILLVERRPQLVTRTDIVDRLWGKGVFVDVETGVNAAIRKVRQALRDSPESPAFVERIPGRGYRFIAAVEVVSAGAELEPIAGLAGHRTAAHVEPTVTTRVLASPEPTSMALAPPAAVDSRVDRRPPLQRRTLNRAWLVTGLAVIALAVLVAGKRWFADGSVAIAVLPFDNFTGDPTRDALTVGLTDETVASLAQIDPERLSVKGRTLHYTAGTKTALEIGRELGVDYLVEATVRGDGEQLRVTATLTRVQNQEHVWSHFYDPRTASDLLEVERELSTDIARQIRLRLSPTRMSALDRRQTHNVNALYAYFSARSFENQRNPKATATALTEYKRAIALDPDYALAWAGLASTYAASTINGDANPRLVADSARQAADEAIRINPNLSEAQKVDGTLKWLIEWKWKAAEAAFRHAIELDRSDGPAFRSLGHALSQLGRRGEADDAMRRTRELEPLEPMSFALSAQVAYQAKDYSAAVGYAQRAIFMAPKFWIGYMQLGQAAEAIGQTTVALEALSDAAQRSHANSKAISLRGYLLARMGRHDEALEVLRTLEEGASTHYVPPYAMALVEAGLGEREKVFEWLEKAYVAQDVHLIYLPVDPKWDPYRPDPRFSALLAKCGFVAGN
jgi:DNA-binding winged helix-turn-helix (wHTH) protein/TolB-like protein/Tfp pilus assembly protein PilF